MIQSPGRMCLFTSSEIERVELAAFALFEIPLLDALVATCCPVYDLKEMRR